MSFPVVFLRRPAIVYTDLQCPVAIVPVKNISHVFAFKEQSISCKERIIIYGNTIPLSVEFGQRKTYLYRKVGKF